MSLFHLARGLMISTSLALMVASSVFAKPTTRVAAPPKPVFEYKGFRAGEIVPAARLATCLVARDNKLREEQIAQAAAEKRPLRSYEQRPPLSPDKDDCGDSKTGLAGVPLILEEIKLYRQIPSSITVMFGAGNFKTVTDALKAKYGAPCKIGVNQVQNSMGAKFASPYYQWCFASGRLKADMLYPDIETSTVEWEDPSNQPPAAAPKIDF